MTKSESRNHSCSLMMKVVIADGASSRLNVWKKCLLKYRIARYLDL